MKCLKCGVEFSLLNRKTNQKKRKFCCNLHRQEYYAEKDKNKMKDLNTKVKK